MNKTTKNILIALAVLIVLCAATVLLFVMPQPGAEEETAESSTTSVVEEENKQIIDHTAEEVKQITLENNLVDETWEIVPVMNEDGTSVSTFTFKGWEDASLMTSDIATVARSFYTLYEMKEIGEVQNLDEYGLKGSGEIKAEIDFKDGSSETIVVGIPAGESSGRYVLVDGVVYIASMSTFLETSKYDFVTTTVLSIETPPTVGENGTTMENEPKAHRMHFSGKNYPEEILLQESDHRVYTYEMSTPIFAGASVTQIEEIVQELISITASGAVAVHATDEEKAEWGIDDPSVVLEFTINEEDHVITLGNLKNGEYSLMIDDNDVIYTIPEDRVDTWAKKSVYDLREAYVYLVNIKYAKRVTIEDENGKAVYDVTRTEDTEKSTETTPYYNITIKKDGKDVDYTTAYQPFYASLLSVCVLNEETVEPTAGKPIFTASYEYFEDSDKDVVEFYAHPTNERRCVVFLNGQNMGVVRESDIADLIEKNEIVSNYGALKDAE